MADIWGLGKEKGDTLGELQTEDQGCQHPVPNKNSSPAPGSPMSLNLPVATSDLERKHILLERNPNQRLYREKEGLTAVVYQSRAPNSSPNHEVN